MLRHAIVCFVIAVSFDSAQKAAALQLRDISRLIENLQGNEAKYYDKSDDQSQEMGKNNGHVAMSSRELDALINQVANDVYNQNKNKNKKSNFKYLKSNDRVSDTREKGLEQLLSSQSGVQRNPIRDVLSDLATVNSLQADSENGALMDDSYSKVYLILNPQANLREKDKRGISDILSQLLSGSSAKKIYSQRNPLKKEHKYKGFALSEGLMRRRNRESKEMYSPPDSLEDFKPKRGRSEYGGSGGRTPIPYIRHRDIYERD